jgi:hypothetical protein
MVDGGYAYGYLFMSQNKEAEYVFKELLNEIRPSRILEIGTFHGGLTLMLRDILDSYNLHNSTIKTYDINNQEFLRPLVTNRKVEVITDNLFNGDYSDFKNESKKNEILNFIQQEGCSLVLCDGGCKRCEFNLIAPLLKSNDIIMAHDYAPNNDYFQHHIRGKIWDWMEIQDSDIYQAIVDNNFKSFKETLTQQAAWCCKIKSSS